MQKSLSTSPKVIPKPDGIVSLGALRAMLTERSVMSAFSAFHASLGDVFRLQLPGFHPVVLVGPEANEWVLVKEQAHLQWRSENDPIARLLRHGLLVEDGPIHDEPRAVMNPALYKPALPAYVNAMVRGADAIVTRWHDGQSVDLLDEMRKISLLIVYDTLFMSDFSAGTGTPVVVHAAPAALHLARPVDDLGQRAAAGLCRSTPSGR